MKFLSIVALALVGAVMTSCSSEDNAVEQAPQQPTSKDNIVTLTTTVSLGGDEAGARSTTRAVDAEGYKTFSVGDQIDVVYVNTSDKIVKATSVALTSSDIKNSGKSADFTVTLTNPQTGIATSIRYFYPAGKVDAEGSLDFSWLDEQNGTIEGLSSNEDICQRAIRLLETLPAENNYILRQWQACGLKVATAADSQALIQLKRQYCDRIDCLRCRFGYEYLSRSSQASTLS